jgi:hypothetical protein
VRKLNPTLIALLGGVVILIGLILFFATGRNPDQDKLSDTQIAANQAESTSPEKRCSSKATYELIKKELFSRAAQVRGNDRAAYEQLEAYAVLRVENPVLESEDSATGALNCSASISLDLPPGVAVAGGRRTLTADVDYTIQPSADADVLLLRNPEPIVAPLSTLTRVAEPVVAPPEGNEVAPEEMGGNAAASESATAPVGPVTSYPGRPSFDCSRAQTRGEIAVCSDPGLSVLDVNMTRQYLRSLGTSTPDQHALLQSTRNRFVAYRDRCPNRQCIADAYLSRMREIRDIMEGRWQPGR